MTHFVTGSIATVVGVLALTACGARDGLGGITPDDVAPETAAPTHTQPVTDCIGAGTTYIYAVTEQRSIYRFDPRSAEFALSGTLRCKDVAVPFSMAVDRTGTAYVEYGDGSLFRVDLATLDCQLTPFVPGQMGWRTFGMSYAANAPSSGETLCVADSNNSSESLGLARLDTSTFLLDFIGPFSEPVGSGVELTGTSDGRLFAFGPQASGGAKLAEIDPTSAVVLSVVNLPIGSPAFAFAIAAWSGDFYAFTNEARSGPTRIDRYDPSDGSVTKIATVKDTVVGVGVSTCAPK